MKDERLKILTGICGGVAAYKAVEVVSALRKDGHEVHVAMTGAAQQFVTPLTFAAVSGRRVLSDLFPNSQAGDLEDLYPHLYPATEADLFILIPATADMIAQVAHGQGKDVVATSALSLPNTCRRYYAPAMNVEMWEQIAVQENVKRLDAVGWNRIGPEAGHLACGTEGCGRMTEPRDIMDRLRVDLANRDALAGRKVLIVSGPTREYLDPVRFIGNASSGKMGKAIAETAMAWGADVDFVTGPVNPANLPFGDHVNLYRVNSAQEMLEAAQGPYRDSDLVIYVAAVADYTPVEYHDQKLPKTEGDLTIQLKSTPDIAATLNQEKREDQIVIGFALQTHDGEAKARAKLHKKHLDAIVLNSPEALGANEGSYRFLNSLNGKEGFADWGTLSKRNCAERIIEAATGALTGNGANGH